MSIPSVAEKPLPAPPQTANIPMNYLSVPQPQQTLLNVVGNATPMNAANRISFHSSIYHYFQRLEEQEEKERHEQEALACHDPPSERSTKKPAAKKTSNAFQGILDEMLKAFPYLENFPVLDFPPIVELRYHSTFANHQAQIAKLQNEKKMLEQENKKLVESLEKTDLTLSTVLENTNKRKGEGLEEDSEPKRARIKKPLTLQANVVRRNDVPVDVKDLIATMRKNANTEKRNNNKKVDRLQKQITALEAEKEKLEQAKISGVRKDAESNRIIAAKPRPRTEAEIADEIKKRNGSTGPLTDEERSQVVARKLELAMAGVSTEHVTAPKWEERFEALVHFHKGYNHCRVPVRTPGLGRWVAQMRSDYRVIMSKPEGEEREKMYSFDAWSLNEERIEKLKSLGFEFQLSESVPWELRFNELVEFKALHGHCKVPRGYKENIKLSEWVHMQRKNYRKKLPSIIGERVDKLNEIGFLWDVKKANPSFEERLTQLREFRRKHGHLDVPLPPLYQSHLKLTPGGSGGATGGDDDDNVDDENDGEINTSPTGGDDADDESTDPEVISFRRWVQRQRDDYNTCYLLVKKCSLDKARVKKLEELGFSFERVRKSRGSNITDGHLGRKADPDKYKSRLDKLRIVKEICGDCNKARDVFPDDQILLDWMKAQRKQWKNWQEGRKTSLTTERRLQLEELGFMWQPRSHYAPYGSKSSERKNSKAEAEAAAVSMAQFSQEYNDYGSHV